MAFASGPILFQRFHYSSSAVQQVDDAFIEALDGRAFVGLEPQQGAVDVKIGGMNKLHNPGFLGDLRKQVKGRVFFELPAAASHESTRESLG